MPRMKGFVRIEIDEDLEPYFYYEQGQKPTPLELEETFNEIVEEYWASGRLQDYDYKVIDDD